MTATTEKSHAADISPPDVLQKTSKDRAKRERRAES